MAWTKARRHRRGSIWGFPVFLLTSNDFGTHLMTKNRPLRVVVPRDIFYSMDAPKRKALRKAVAAGTLSHMGYSYAAVGIEVA